MSTPARLASRSLLSLALGLAACAPTADLGVTAQGIANGVDDNTHTNVVGIAIFQGRGLATCTGSLIAPNLVLTARHCVSPVDSEGILCSDATIGGVARTATVTSAPYAASSFTVTTDLTISLRGRNTTVAEVLVPPDSTGVRFCGRDIALLRLSAPIRTTGIIRPRLDIAPQESEVFTASGYGATSADGTGAGRRRMREGLTVQHVGRALARLGLTVLEESEWLADEGTCRGDSGGPALDEVGDVFGVLSRGSAQGCESPIYTRVDSYADWIRAQAARAAQLGGYTPPSWVIPPSPGAGDQGHACLSDIECAATFNCLPTGHARECTAIDCAACPTGWVCSEFGDHCVRDPSLAPADAATAPADAATEPPADVAPPTTPRTTTAPQDGGCSVSPSGTQGRLSAFAFAALAACCAGLARRSRRARR